MAAWKGHKAVVKLLLETKADLNVRDVDDGRTALHRAASCRHEAVVKLLLEAKADANLQDADDGRTALHMAAEYGYVAVVELLLETGADGNVQARDGRNALQIAARKGDSEVAWLLQWDDA